MAVGNSANAGGTTEVATDGLRCVSVGFHFERSRTRSAPLVISRFLPAITTADPTSRSPWQRSRDPSAWNHRVTLGSPPSVLNAQCAIFGWICDFYIRKSLTYCSKCKWFFQPLELLPLVYKNLHRATVLVQLSCHLPPPETCRWMNN